MALIHTYLERSSAAWDRHSKNLEEYVRELNGAITRELGNVKLDPLDVLMFSLGDHETKRALVGYFQGGPHPIHDMDGDSVMALDSALAKEIVTLSTVDAGAKVRVSDRPKSTDRVDSKKVHRK